MTTAIDVASQLDELRRAVQTLQAGISVQPRMSLVAVESAPFLGQSVGLTLTLLNRADLTPMPGVAVTLVTSWGVLRGKDNPIEGTSIATTTASDGSVRVTLRPQMSLDDNEDQDALELMLAQLDPAAVSPQDIAPTLQTMAQEYRWEANQGFRNALDGYFRDFGQDVLHSGPLHDYMSSWLLIPATVIAVVNETDNNTSVAATVTIEFRDWLGAWLQVYRGVASPQVQLGNDYKDVQTKAGSAAGLIAAVFNHTATLVDNEYGEIGKKVAQQGAQRALDDFVNTGLGGLSADVRATVGPVLTTGARALVTAGESVVAAIGQAHAVAVNAATSVADKVGRADLTAALAVKANAADLQLFQSQTNAVLTAKANVTDLQTLQTAVASKAEQSALTAFQSQTATALAAKADEKDFSALQDQVGKIVINKGDLDNLQASFAAFEDQTNAALTGKANVADLQTLQDRTTTALAAKADQKDFRALQDQVGKIVINKGDIDNLQASLATFEGQTNNALSGKANVTDLQILQTAVASKADQSTFAAFQSQTTTALASKADQTAFQNLQNQVGRIVVVRGDIGDLQTAVSTLQTQTTTALAGKADVADLQTLQTAVAAKADQATLAAFQTQTASALEAKADQSTVTAFQSQTALALRSKADTSAFSTLQGRLTVLEGRMR